MCNYDTYLFTRSPEFFLSLVESRPWFELGCANYIDRDTFFEKKEYSEIEKLQYMIALIFGSSGFERDLDKAETLALAYYNDLLQKKPLVNRRIDDENWMGWQKQFARVSLIIGSLNAVREEYVKAVYHFMRALKTQALILCNPFLTYVEHFVKKIQEMPCEEIKREGWGYSKDMPMGSTVKAGGVPHRAIAPFVFAALEGREGDVIVFFQDRNSTVIGPLERKGSIMGASSEHMIDIYETLMIDRDYNLFKLQLYFNSCFIDQYEDLPKPELRVPKEFYIVPNDIFADIFETV